MNNTEFLESLFPEVLREADNPRNPEAYHVMTFWAGSRAVAVTYKQGDDRFGVDLPDDTSFGAGSDNWVEGREKAKERIHNLLFGV